MCGRYASSRSPEDLAQEFEALDPRLEQPLPPSWNVAPTDEVYAVLERLDRDETGERVGEPVRRITPVRWGLVPSWAKDASIGSRMINARVETVAEKPAFRKAFAARRCIIPADGYYEWYVLDDAAGGARGKKAKQPFFIRPADDGVVAMAGLYEIWRDRARPDDDPAAYRWTCTVMTTEASDDLGQIHDRMPLLVPAEARATWLDPRIRLEAADLDDLLAPAQQSGLVAHPVSAAVGNVRNNNPDLVRPIAVEAPAEDDLQGRLL